MPRRLPDLVQTLGILDAGIDTEIWFFPVVCTWAPDTPRPFTRRLRMLTVSSRSDWGTLALGLVHDRDPTGQVKPESGSPLGGEHGSERTERNDHDEEHADQQVALCRFWLAPGLGAHPSSASSRCSPCVLSPSTSSMPLPSDGVRFPFVEFSTGSSVT